MQHDQVNIHCPFCHHKGAYPNDPAGSTLRCHECKAIFRMPAIKRHRKGEIIRGERISTGAGKRAFLLLLVLAILGVGGYYGYSFIANRPKPIEQEEDPFALIPDLHKADTPYGTLQRFLESWKMGKLDLLLKFVRQQDREAAQKDNEEYLRLQAVFVDDRLINYSGAEDTTARVDEGYVQYRLEIDAENQHSQLKKKGLLKPCVYAEFSDNGTVRGYAVDLGSAFPKWDD